MKVVDMHCDTIYSIKKDHSITLRENNLMIDLKKLQEGDYLLQNFAMFTKLDEDEPVSHVMDMIDVYYEQLDQNSDIIRPVYSYQDIEENMKNGYISALLTLEEGDVINQDLSYLRNYYRLGVRMATLTWNFENSLGYPNWKTSVDIGNAAGGHHIAGNMQGLKPLGIEFVKECERLGIILDVSHLSDGGFYDILNNTTKPFVASHSNARAVTDHPRNLTDDMICELAKRGGVMGINFCGDFLDESGKSKVEYLVKHMNYIKQLAGVDVIGLGTDFDGIDPDCEISNASMMHYLYTALKEDGWSEEDIEKVFYKNVLRLYKEVLR